jgi:hypothetical protein
MSQLTPSSIDSPIRKCLEILGLNLSESEIGELKVGKLVSLESKDLSEIGSLFILADALSAVNLGKTKKKIAFRDLLQALTESAHCSGIPIYCWQDNSQRKWCIYLTLSDGKPAVRTCYCCPPDDTG